MSDPDALSPAPSPVALKLRVGRLTFDPHRIIYATIMLMTAFAIYDEGTDPFQKGPLIQLLGVALAPLFALAMAHAFSDALDVQIRNGRRLTGADRRHLLWSNLEYMYVAIPPILLTIALALLGWDANDVVFVVQILGLASLFFWGAYAARTAGLGGWRQATFGFNYSLMGLVVIGVELLLTH
jgi:hypothetical protein